LTLFTILCLLSVTLSILGKNRNNISNKRKKDSILKEDDSLYSTNNKFKCTMQKDGNFAVFKTADNSLKFKTKNAKTNGGPYRLEMQIDANLVIYGGQEKAVWSTGTTIVNKNKRNGPYKAVCRNNGCFTVQNNKGKKLWSSCKRHNKRHRRRHHKTNGCKVKTGNTVGFQSIMWPKTYLSLNPGNCNQNNVNNCGAFPYASPNFLAWEEFTVHCYKNGQSYCLRSGSNIFLTFDGQSFNGNYDKDGNGKCSGNARIKLYKGNKGWGIASNNNPSKFIGANGEVPSRNQRSNIQTYPNHVPAGWEEFKIVNKK